MNRIVRLWFVIGILSCSCQSNNNGTPPRRLDHMNIDKVLDQYKLATTEFLKGNAEPYKMMFSHREDVTLSNPLFPTVRGWEKVSETLEQTAARLRDGELVNSMTISKYVTPELAYVVSIVD